MGWFRKSKDASQYEKQIRDISGRIDALDQRRVKWNLKLRRLRAMLTLYSVMIYAAYSIYVFFGQSQRRQPSQLLGLVLAPVLIGVCRHVFQLFIRWMMNNMDEKRKNYDVSRGEIVEEIKKNLNFNAAKAILDRYDVGWNLTKEPGSKSTSDPKISKDKTTAPKQEKLSKEELQKKKEQEIESKLRQGMPDLNPTNENQIKDEMQNPMMAPGSRPEPAIGNGPSRSVRPMPPIKVVYEPRWYDRILEYMVGEDEQSANNRFALICPKCYAHNGLCQYGEDPRYIIYICPHCGHRNGRERPSERSNTPLSSNQSQDGESESETISVRNASPSPLASASPSPAVPDEEGERRPKVIDEISSVESEDEDKRENSSISSQ